jgi:hypothetical protein
MLVWTWRAWPDPLIDFGRELYVPWRLSGGDALFTDVAWFNGPLSQYWNALLFRIFGPGMIVLALGNVAVLTACALMLHGLIARMADRVAATTATLVLLLVFAFGQYVGIGNYNWVTPYSHELTHGIALALAALAGLARWHRTGSSRAAALAGVSLGLCFLTKPEPFLAGASGCLVLLVAAGRRRDLRALGAFAAAALLPVVASTLLVGGRGTLGAWPSALGGEVGRLSFYAAGMGLDQPALRIEEVLAWSGIWLLVLAAAVAVAWLGRETRGALLPLVSGAATLALLGVIPAGDGWTGVLRPLPLAVPAIAACLFVSGRGGRQPARTTVALAFAAFSLVLLGKTLLRARVAHYGFALAMPATLLVVTATVAWLPAHLDGRGLRGGVVRACALALIAFFSIEQLSVTATWMAGKTERVGAGRDRFRADVRGAFVQGAIDSLAASGARSAAVLPEGVMINYLARLPNPTPYVNFMPPEEVVFGDEAWVRAFDASPPDVVVIVPKDTSEYGLGAFGVGYGTGLAAWVEANYAPRSKVRVGGLGFAITLLVPR